MSLFEALDLMLASVPADALEESLLLARRRLAYMFEVASVRAAMSSEMQRICSLTARALAHSPAHAHQTPLQHQTLATAVWWGLLGAVEHWYAHGSDLDAITMAREALAVLRTGH